MIKTYKHPSKYFADAYIINTKFQSTCMMQDFYIISNETKKSIAKEACVFFKVYNKNQERILNYFNCADILELQKVV